jgi:hypothetical protein
MLTVDDAKAIAARWREKFVDDAAFEVSWSRYFETATVPDTVRLEAWLLKDLAKDEVRHAGIVREPLLPTRSRYAETDCPHCAGLGYVRVEVLPFDLRFGKALRCPDCNGGLRSEACTASSEPVGAGRSGFWCYRCGANETEPARAGCTYPSWHSAADLNAIPSVTFETVLRRF